MPPDQEKKEIGGRLALTNNLRGFVENMPFCHARTSANIKMQKTQ